MASLGGTPSQNSAIDINFKNENSEISPKNNEFKEKFNLQLANFYNEQIGTVKKPWTIDRVAEVTHHIITGKEAQAAGARRTSTQYYWTSKYDVISIETEDVLIMKKKTPQDPTVQIVPIENYFDLLFTVHHKLGHGARDKMLNYIKKKFYVQKKAVEIFLSLCTTCEVKRNMPRKGAASRLATPSSTNSPNDFNNRGQVDLIDLQTTPDGEFKWLLMYQDHSTQFIQLRPLRSNQASEVATELVKIYLIFGAPFVLQSNNGQEFTAKVIEEIMNLWPNCTITHGGSRHPQTREKAENNTQEVTNTLHAWMRRNKSSNWAMGCHFVQYEKNVSFCKSVGSTPYHALLGCDPKSEQESPNISLNIEFIKTEEDEQISTQNNGMEVNSLTSANTVYTDIKEERHSDNESESSPESEYEQQDLTKVIHEPSVVKRETICFDPVSVKLESADLTQDPCVSVKKEPGSIVPGLMEPECVVQEGRAHGEEIDVTDPASSAASADSLTSEIHACSECPKTYNKPWLLRAHMRIHTGEKPYQCSMCAKRFTNNRDLKKHERVHTGEKPYSCGTCGKRFTNSHQLKVHVRIHTGEKPYRCGVCQKQFTQLATLQKHERTHTGERPYGCPLCEKSYASSSHLKRHSQVHEKLKPDQGRYRAGVIETEVLLGGFEFGLEEPAPEATPV